MADRTDTFYAAEEAMHGYAAQLLMGDGSSPEQFEAIAALNNITPGAMTTEDIDRTHLRSPDAHKEHMAGMRDSGPFAADGIWLPEEQSQSNAGGGTGPFANGGVIAKWRGRQNHNFKLVVVKAAGSPAAIEWPFRAYVSQFQPGAIGTADAIRFQVAFQPTEAYDAALP